MKARNITLLHYDAILFDVDGTLIDSAPGIIHTLQEVFCTMCVDVSGINLRRYLGPPLRKSFGEHFTDPANPEAGWFYFVHRHLQAHQGGHPYFGGAGSGAVF